MNRKKWIILIASVVVIGAVLLFIFMRKPKEQLALESTKPSYISILNSVTATGTLEPVIEVEVGTQVSGIIDKLYVDYNDEVTAGQVIAEMDRVTLQAELESAQAQLASAQTEYDYQLKNYNRTKTLFEKEMVSESEYDEAYYNYKRTYNTLEQSKAAMVKVKRNLGYATITSPIDGVVISRAVEEGQTVAAGFETPKLFVIAKDLTQMQVIADVDEADIGQVALGQRVEFNVDAYPDDVFVGEVTQVRLEAQTTSNVVTYEVVVSAPNPDLKLKPGLTANIRIITLEESNVLAVPTRALRFVPDSEQIATLHLSSVKLPDSLESSRKLWVKRGNQLVETVVTVGSASGDMSQIESGINPDDEVAVVMNIVEGKAAAADAQTERSPFMPTPPGQKK